VLSANASATLDYCPIAIASCAPGQYLSVPAAEDFGGDTGETSTGLSMCYSGTTEFATSGPFILRGLWGYPAAAGSAAGATPVTNAITVSGSPDPTSTTPYVFVFLNGSTFVSPRFEWAPDEPVWYLPPGTYQYEVMLADYAEQTGTLVVGTNPTSLSVTLPYHPSSGVYTPLWAFGNAQLAGISSSGDGSLANQYQLFNNPTAGCSECGNAPNGDLSPAFALWNDFEFPAFAGMLIDGTDAYVDVDHPVSFCVFGFTYGPASQPLPGPNFYLQIELVSAHHVTVANDPFVGGWPAMYELETLAGLLAGAENPFPTANMVLWNSSDNLVMSNTFVPTWLTPFYEPKCVGVCPAVACDGCAPPDGLLLYGGRNNTIWGNTFRDPSAPASAPTEQYAGLAEAESGDLIFNNIFTVDNPTIYLPFDIYNNSCWMGLAGNCFPPIPPTYADRWNVTSQSASDVAATVNGFALSGNVLGSDCGDQGGNYWYDYGSPPNPYGALPFVNAYDYTALLTALPPGTEPSQNSIRIGGDYAPLNPSLCVAPPALFGSVLLTPTGIAVMVPVAAIVVGVVVLMRTRWKVRPAPWLLPPQGGAVTSAPGDVTTAGVSGAGPTHGIPASPRPTLRERWARRPPSLGFLVGVGMLGVYVVAAVSAVFVFGSSLGTLPRNWAWVPPYNPIGPSSSHLFGVMPGFGTDLFNAIWRATPWDLAIVAGILAIDVFLGFFLGAIAGLDEGGLADATITFVGDSLGSIPTFLLAVVVFAGLIVVAPNSVGLPIFVAVFGIILWPTLARTVRERARTVAHERYVEAARASGATFPSILVRHVLPNAVGPVLAQLPLDLAPIFFVLSAFPWYYNCQLPGGPPPPPGHPPPPPLPYLFPNIPAFSALPSAQFPEWGYLLGFGTCEGFSFPGGFDYWWMYLFPLLAIVGLGVALGLVCDGIERWRQFNR
jgi:ABC-type dipeptide/oligopeptide/nickel transport system permease subunit